jgi:F-type H+-transporting ATPase subunit delta
VAEQSNSASLIEQDMRDLLAMLSSSKDLSRAFASPLLNKQVLQNIVSEIARTAKFNPITQNFLGVLAQNNRLASTQLIAQAVLKICASNRGEVEAIVKTAHALSDTQQQALKDNLKQSLGLTAHLNITIDPTLLGGMMVTVGSKMMDDTVKSKLDRLKQNLLNSSNQNNATKEVA